jgi:hypothetical protein
MQPHEFDVYIFSTIPGKSFDVYDCLVESTWPMATGQHLK